MKIAHISTVHPTFDGRIFHKECVSLAKAGFETHLIVQHTKNETVNGVVIHGIPKFNGRLNRIIEGNKIALSKALELDADVYHFHDPELLPVGLKLKKKGYKVIFDMHELVGLMIRSKEWIPKPLRWFIEKSYAQIEKKAFKRFEKIIVVTEKMVEEYTSVVYPKFKEKVAIIRNFSLVESIAKAKPKFERKDKDTVFIYVGGLTKERGILEVVQAVQKVNDAKLWLLGPWQNDTFSKECKAADVCDKMEYFGLLPMPEVYGYIQSADVGLTVLNPTVNHLASLPVKAFEYMAASKPQIMSNFPFWMASFEGCGKFVTPGNKQELIKSMRFFVENKAERETIGKNSFQLVNEEYSWEAESTKLIKIYQEI